MTSPERSRFRALRSLSGLAVLAGAALATLACARPHLAAGALGRGDDLALLAAWAVAVAASAWLFAGTAACAIALACSRPGLARRLAPTLPFGLRRLVEIAIVGSCIALPALPAGATAPPPRTVIVLADQPVVRSLTPPATTAPAPTPTTRPTTPARSNSPASTSPTTAAPVAAPSTAPATLGSAPHRPVPRTTPGPVPVGAHVVVRAGDNLWRIASAALAGPATSRPTDAEVARYWRAVIAANRATLRSGDPSLIFPGEIVSLPPASAVS